MEEDTETKESVYLEKIEFSKPANNWVDWPDPYDLLGYYEWEKKVDPKMEAIFKKVSISVMLIFLGILLGPSVSQADIFAKSKIPKEFVELTPELKAKILAESQRIFDGTGIEVKDFRRIDSKVKNPNFNGPKKSNINIVEVI